MGLRNSRRTRPTDLRELAELTEDEVVQKESENGLRQFDRTMQLVREAIAAGEF